LLYRRAKGGTRMKSETKRTPKATHEARNEWGGVDYRGKAGLARTAVEDGVTTVSFFVRNGRADLMAWKATFDAATPAVLTRAAVQEARRLADGSTETRQLCSACGATLVPAFNGSLAEGLACPDCDGAAAVGEPVR